MVSKLVVTVMMRPQPRLIMGSAANRVIRNAPIALIATMRCPFGVRVEELDAGFLVRGRRGHADAGAIDEDIERAEGPDHLVNGMPAICDLGHIGDGAEESSGKDRFR